MRLSIVVPVGPGEQAWRELLPDLAALGTGTEIVLVSPPRSAPASFDPASFGLARPARWIEAPAGRACQQNAGARLATGTTLWFLHADSRLPRASVEAAMRFAGQEALGYFELRFRRDGPRLVRLNALGARIRSRWLGLPFGDQGLMLPRGLFTRLGGFDESLASGEDHALVWAVRRAGISLVALDAAIYTSARRYAEKGWLRTTLRHLRMSLQQARAFSATPEQRE